MSTSDDILSSSDLVASSCDRSTRCELSMGVMSCSISCFETSLTYSGTWAMKRLSHFPEMTYQSSPSFISANFDFKTMSTCSAADGGWVSSEVAAELVEVGVTEQLVEGAVEGAVVGGASRRSTREGGDVSAAAAGSGPASVISTEAPRLAARVVVEALLWSSSSMGSGASPAASKAASSDFRRFAGDCERDAGVCAVSRNAVASIGSDTAGSRSGGAGVAVVMLQCWEAWWWAETGSMGRWKVAAAAAAEL